MIRLMPFGYVDDIQTFLDTKNEEEAKQQIKPYNFRQTVAENFSTAGERYICIRLSRPEDKIEVLPDPSSVFLTKPSHLEEVQELRFFIVDYDTLFGTRYNTFKKYDSQFFTCEERVLFEAFLIKYKRANFKQFKWEKSKIGYELGIARKRRDTIIEKFQDLGIIKSAYNRGVSDRDTHRNKNSYYFDLDPYRIVELLPKIFSEFDYEKVEHDIKRYLKPALEEEKLT